MLQTLLGMLPLRFRYAWMAQWFMTCAVFGVKVVCPWHWEETSTTQGNSGNWQTDTQGVQRSYNDAASKMVGKTITSGYYIPGQTVSLNFSDSSSWTVTFPSTSGPYGIYSPLYFIPETGSSASGEANATYMPATDFFNNARTTNDIGAIVFASPGTYTPRSTSALYTDPWGNSIGAGLTVTQNSPTVVTLTTTQMASAGAFQTAINALSPGDIAEMPTTNVTWSGGTANGSSGQGGAPPCPELPLAVPPLQVTFVVGISGNVARREGVDRGLERPSRCHLSGRQGDNCWTVLRDRQASSYRIAPWVRVQSASRSRRICPGRSEDDSPDVIGGPRIIEEIRCWHVRGIGFPTGRGPGFRNEVKRTVDPVWTRCRRERNRPRTRITKVQT